MYVLYIDTLDADICLLWCGRNTSIVRPLYKRIHDELNELNYISVFTTIHKSKLLLVHKISNEIYSFISRPKYEWRFLCPSCPIKSTLRYDTRWKPHRVLCDECGLTTMWRGYSCSMFDERAYKQWHAFCMDCVYGKVLKKQMFTRVLSDLIGGLVSHDSIDLIVNFAVGEIVRVSICASKRTLQQSRASAVIKKVSKRMRLKKKLISVENLS